MKGRLPHVGLVVLAVGLIIAALTPISWDFLGPSLDPFLHMFACFSLTILLIGVMRKQNDGFGRAMVKVVIAATLAGAAWAGIEIIQILIPHHGPEMSDFKADVVGSLLAGIGWIAWELSLLTRKEEIREMATLQISTDT